MFSKNAKLREKVIDIVADPHAEESRWLPACVVAGDQPLLLNQPSLLKQSGEFAGKALASVFIGLNLMMTFLVCVFIAGHATWRITGLDYNWYMPQVHIQSGLLFFLAPFMAAGFWWQLGFAKQRWLHRLLEFGGLLGCLLVVGGASAPLLPGIALLICVPGYRAARYFARLFCEHVPKTFPLTAVMLCQGGASVLVGAGCLAAIVSASSGSHHSAPYTKPDQLELVLMAVVLYLSLIMPSAAAARACRSTSVKVCMGLNAVLQAPLLVTLSLFALGSAAIAAIGAVNPALLLDLVHGSDPAVGAANAGQHLAIIGGSALLLPISLSYIFFGSWLGAVGNRRERSKQKLPLA